MSIEKNNIKGEKATREANVKVPEVRLFLRL